MQVVDVVLGLPGASQQTFDRQLGVLRPLPGNAPERVVENEFDSGTRDRLATAGPVKDDVLHRLAAQLGGF